MMRHCCRRRRRLTCPLPLLPPQLTLPQSQMIAAMQRSMWWRRSSCRRCCRRNHRRRCRRLLCRRLKHTHPQPAAQQPHRAPAVAAALPPPPAEDAAAEECVVCLRAPAAGAFVPCGHRHACLECGARVLDLAAQRGRRARCPCCNTRATHFCACTSDKHRRMRPPSPCGSWSSRYCSPRVSSKAGSATSAKTCHRRVVLHTRKSIVCW